MLTIFSSFINILHNENLWMKNAICYRICPNFVCGVQAYWQTCPHPCQVALQSLQHPAQWCLGCCQSPDLWPDQGLEDWLVVHWLCPLLHPHTLLREGAKGCLGSVIIWVSIIPSSTSADTSHKVSQEILALLQQNEVDSAFVKWHGVVSQRLTGPPPLLCTKLTAAMPLIPLLPHSSSWCSPCDWRNGGGFPRYTYALVPWEQRQGQQPQQQGVWS